MKSNALTLIHKYIRAQLFDVARLLSACGTARDEIDAVRRAIEAAVELLHQHAEHEEAGFEPHIREYSEEFADRLLEEHRTLHADLDAIVALAQTLDPDKPGECCQSLLQLYLDWNRFVGAYLLHLDAEERSWFANADSLMPPMSGMKVAPPGWDEDAHQEFLDKLFSVITPSERSKVQGSEPK